MPLAAPRPSTREYTVPPGSKLKMPDGWNLFLRISLSMLSKIQGTSRTQQITRALGNSVASSGSFVHQRRVGSKTKRLSGTAAENGGENAHSNPLRGRALRRSPGSVFIPLLRVHPPPSQ